MSGRGRGRGRGGRGASARGGQIGASGSGAALDGSGNECGTCQGEVGDNGIGCDLCPLWYHPTQACTGLTKGSIQAIQRDGGSGISYSCNKCRCEGQSNNSDLKDSVNQLFQMVTALAASVSQLTNQITALATTTAASTPSSLGQGIDRETLHAEFREYEERKKRTNSLIVRGIPTGNQQVFRTTFARVCQKLDKTVSVSDVVPLGTGGNLCRIQVLNKDERFALLASSKNLKNCSEFSNVYISRDLTFNQRRDLARKRELLRSGRENDPQNSQSQSGQDPILPAAASRSNFQ